MATVVNTAVSMTGLSPKQIMNTLNLLWVCFTAIWEVTLAWATKIACTV